MDVNVIPMDGTTSKALEVTDMWSEQPRTTDGEVYPVGVNVLQSRGTFTTFETSSAGTYTVLTPPSSGSVILSDFMLSTEKQNAGAVEVQFTDGTNTATIFKAFCNDAPVTVAIPFAGRWQGWRDARVDVIVTGATDTTIALGYSRVNFGLEYSAWDSYR